MSDEAVTEYVTLSCPQTTVSGHGGSRPEIDAQNRLYGILDITHYEQGVLITSGEIGMQTYAYVRVSTAGQTTDNQVLEMENGGYVPDAIYSDVVSGKVPAMERPEFRKLVDALSRLKSPKRLIVSKLDRLGRDAANVMATVRTLSDMGCSVRVLQLGDLDLTSSAGKLVLTTLSAVAEMERDILVERTNAGLDRARRDGKKLGRPKAVNKDAAAAIRIELDRKVPVAEIARTHAVSRATIARIRDGQWTA